MYQNSSHDRETITNHKMKLRKAGRASEAMGWGSAGSRRTGGIVISASTPVVANLMTTAFTAVRINVAIMGAFSLFFLTGAITVTDGRVFRAVFCGAFLQKHTFN